MKIKRLCFSNTIVGKKFQLNKRQVWFFGAALFLGLFFCIGSDASAATSIYRSVGPGATADLNLNSRTVEISGTTATFSDFMPDNVGVGDALQYQVAGTFYIAFISGRISSTVYTVQTNAGAAPQAAVAGTAVGVYRAYTSLYNAERGNENDSLNDAVEDFDNWDGSGDYTDTDEVGKNIVSSDEQWNIVCYAGATADSTAVTIDGWATGTDNYLKIYTPTNANEVGISQRHDGRWNDNKYRLETSLSTMSVVDHFVWLDGLQVKTTYNSSIGRHGIRFVAGSATAWGSLSNSIVVGSFAGNTSVDLKGLYGGSYGNTVKIWNNIFYGWENSLGTGGMAIEGSEYFYLYNNTILDSYYGISGDSLAKNNITQGCNDGYYNLDAASDYNVSDIADDAIGANSKNSVTVSFANSSLKNYHLDASDTTARNAGVDLSLEFQDDIDREARPFDAAWDIGADEAAPDSVVPERSSGSPVGELVSGTTSTTISLITNENATCKYSTSAGVPYVSMVNTFSTTGSTNHTTTVSGLTDGNSYIYYVRCADGSGNQNTEDFVINFSVLLPDVTVPVRSSGSPTGTLAVGTTSTTISLATNENATCKYSTTADTAYASMVNTFSTTGGMNHSASVSGLINGGDYVYYVRCQDISANANTDDYAINFSVDSLNININSCGELNQAGATYTLQNDVSSDGTCFYLTQSNITLDLNGHTVTYDNMTPVTVPNGSFESDLAGSWDVSSAPNAARVAGTFIEPVSLWEGSYALNFSTPAPDQYVTSVGSVTIPANTTISIWMMMHNLVSDDATVSVELVGATGAVASKVGKTWRGFAPVNMHYKAGATAETYQVRISISGAESAPVGTIYVDDIRIGRYRAHGIALAATNEIYASIPRCPDCEFFASSQRSNLTVKNGSLIQGPDAGFDCWGIWMGSNTAGLAGGHVIENIASTTNGPDSKFFFTSSGLYNSELRYNTINNSNKILTSRDNYTGSNITAGMSTYSKIHHNTITSGPHNAINMSSNGSANALEIYDNNISLQTYHTNDFAISASGSKIFNNIVDCGSGSNSCRGISGGGIGTIIHDNTISVQQLRRNQEYDGCEGGNEHFIGAYGIQVEYGAQNTQIYNNTVNANAGECNAVALRTNISDTANNINIYDNIFNSISTHQYSRERAMSLKIAGPSTGISADPQAVYKIHDNVFNTNDIWVFSDSPEAGIVFSDNTWQTSGTLRAPFYPLEKFYNGYLKDLVFVDNIYGAGDKERFENASFVDTFTNAFVAEASYNIAWTLDLDVVDQSSAAVAGATVTITDKDGNQVYSGVTDSNGNITTELNEFLNEGGTETQYNPYTVIVSKSGVDATQEVTMDSAKTITMSLALGEPDVIAPGAPTGVSVY